MLQQKSKSILGFSRAQWFLLALFAIYMFEYMVTLTFIDQRSAAITGSVWQLYLHYIDYALVALGFASFALLRRASEQFTFRRTLLLLPSVAYSCTVLLLFLLRLAWERPISWVCWGEWSTSACLRHWQTAIRWGA